MDFSGYDKSHPCYDTINNNKLGTFKDDHDGAMFTTHIGLTPNMYCCVNDDGHTLKTGKGIANNIVKQ